TGTVGFVRPTFEEYPNRYVRERSVSFVPETDDFSYTADDLMAFFAGTGIEALVLINPDNPTGNYLPKADVLRLAAWCGEQGIRLVYDESFSDFADEGGNTLIDDGILAAHPTLVVVKSISKSYGVPGVRLGIAASADTELIAFMRRDVSIWNINSFGEFFLQIAEKYKGDYAKALVGLRASRSELAAALASIDGLRVLPSQANYLMVELTGPMGSRMLAKRLLTERQILIKDLSKKIKRDGRQFIRVAVRTREDNAKLVAALRDMLG
ncbi:MAG: histidinol-phosphate aminotransferase family protein, partial [Atopobiaceae bacterium]|nr:histidinol-phosphate aminotransferase family protein [Atopobiaceae bacterium]